MFNKFYRDLAKKLGLAIDNKFLNVLELFAEENDFIQRGV